MCIRIIPAREDREFGQDRAQNGGEADPHEPMVSRDRDQQ
jgi:hypothetical protein